MDYGAFSSDMWIPRDIPDDVIEGFLSTTDNGLYHQLDIGSTSYWILIRTHLYCRLDRPRAETGQPSRILLLIGIHRRL